MKKFVSVFCLLFVAVAMMAATSHVKHVTFYADSLLPPPCWSSLYQVCMLLFFPVVFVSECTTKSVGSPTTSLAAASTREKGNLT